MKKMTLVFWLLVSAGSIHSCKKIPLEDITQEPSVFHSAETNEDNEDYLRFEEKRKQAKYDALKTELSQIQDWNRLIFATSSTANIFHQLKIRPLGVIQSKNLIPDLQALQDEGSVGNIGSALSPNAEVIVALKPSAVLLSNAMPHVPGSLKKLADEGLFDLILLPQRRLEDIFLLLQVLKENGVSDQAVVFAAQMAQDIKEAKDLAENSKIQNATAAIIQVSPGNNSVQGSKSLIGTLVQKIGITNIFPEAPGSSEPDMETLLLRDPKFLILYGHGNNGATIARDFAVGLGNEDSVYRGMQAIKNQSYIVIPDPGSANLETSGLLLELARKMYGDSHAHS
ncbi:ABC transporter substrate-binding protein [Candidatus Haliotispira prima]|uniref:ABC transporter substrate-binding protein n=1 Tax=Candidatus Haliotispira prima TaxID=3034016 RepID=A0ABY8MHB4_9SPIO|nr:ABC transporter substrate-binding protein [Candidatus Haliotispira prima]